MNARILIVDAAQAMAAGAILESMADEGLIERLEVLAIPENTGIGYMEFFDWLAGTDNYELATLANCPVMEIEELTQIDRHKRALKIWQSM